MGLFSGIEVFRFKDTVFYKEENDLQDKYNALKRLNEEYPNNEDLLSELFIVKKGLEGENEISYQLKKSNIGMYVLRDVKYKYEDLTAQIDYIVITPVYTYFVECKNLVGNITVTDKGDFIRELTINGRNIKKGMYSPLRQVEAQREVFRKIWEKQQSRLKKLLASSSFEFYRRVLVVAANKETILNTNRAPKDIKHKILRADALINQIQYDLNHKDKNEYIASKKEMEERAEYYIELSSKEDIDYYNYYKDKYCKDAEKSDTKLKENKDTEIKTSKDVEKTDAEIKANKDVKKADTEIKEYKDIAKSDAELKEKLIQFRKNRANEMKMPLYYIFTNEELEKLVSIKPKTVEELKNVLPAIKVKVHGELIVKEINE